MSLQKNEFLILKKFPKDFTKEQNEIKDTILILNDINESMDYANNYVLIYKLNREKPYILQTDRNNDILQMLSNH